jgi:hypothetical protein
MSIYSDLRKLPSSLSRIEMPAVPTICSAPNQVPAPAPTPQSPPESAPVPFCLWFLLTMFSVGPATYAACPADLVSKHNQYYQQYESEIFNEARSGDATVYYYTSLYLHGILSGLDCTRDEARLQKLIQIIDIMIATAQDFNGDGYKEWAPIDDRGWPQQLSSWQAEAGIARAAAYIMNDATFKSKYGVAAQRWIDFIYQDVIKRWYFDVYDQKIPYVEWGGGKLWSDKDSHFLTIMVHLYKATGNAFYRDIAVRGANFFKAKLQVNGTGWVWDNGGWLGLDGNTNGAPDTSHANREPMWMVASYEAGIVFTRDDVNRMANTLNDIIWNKSTTNPMFTNYINGGNTVYRNSNLPWENGVIYCGWVMLGRYSSTSNTISRLIFDAEAAGVSNTTNPSLRYYHGGDARISLSGHLIRNSMGTTTPEPAPAPTPAPTVTLAVSKTSAQGGETVSVTMKSSAALDPSAWIGIFAKGTTDNSQHLDYFRLNGTKTTPATGFSSATISFQVPNSAGEYEFRLFAGNQGYTLLATSPTVTATVPAPTPSVDSIAPTVTIVSPLSGTIVKRQIVGIN